MTEGSQGSDSTLKNKFRMYASGMKLQPTVSVSEKESFIIDECDSTHLLNRNTESFQCLAQLLISSSSLMKNRLFLFPPLEDPGISVTFNFVEPPSEIDDVGVGKYREMCHDMEIVPISRIIKSLPTDTLDLKYYGLTVKQIKALTEALKPNTHVQTLILQDNWLDVEMASLISDLLVENTILQDLSLQECRIGAEGAEKLGNALSGTQSILSLNLSFNDLGDQGLLALQKGLCENSSLKKLNISHNNLTENSGEILEKILLENKYIDDLDLSWNGFFTVQCNRKIFTALTNSDRIKTLNLSWNGINLPQAASPISRYVKKSETLEHLDISNNRLVGQSLRMIRGSILKNTSLKSVKIGNNIYPPEESHLLLTALAGKTKDPLNYLDMENMYINKESKVVLNNIKKIGKTVKIGGILSDYEIKGPNSKKLIYDRCRYILNKPKKQKAKKDFGHFILSLPDRPMAPDEFLKEIKKQKIKKLDKDLLQAVMNLFQTKKKEIDCPELVKDYMSYFPDTVLPPPKPKKGKKGKKGRKGKKEEQVIKVHDLETDTQAEEKKDDADQTKPINNEASQPALTNVAASKASLKPTEENTEDKNT
ncbi:hypothetical protein GWI33_004799 [Rhynchophorus ferrugineus]|uniref:Uncharacterized protein n=1 Tax=Rhynchophorus ferrugineus TaxID=354439 RepID=A0A834IKD6_RHYFE|nr:hypothetical protein GWI33_004799 [Rhynchophorus ferrugineus]